MKKVTLGIFLLCVLSLFISCGDDKKSPEQKTTGTSKTSTKANEKKAPTITSVILYDGTPFYTENSDGKMVYADEAPLGDTIRIYMVNNEIEQKEAIRLLKSGKEESFNFVHLSYFGKDYWTRDIFITNDSAVIPGFINAQAITYGSPDSGSATTKKIDEGSIVAVNESSKAKDPDLDIEYIEVTYYNGTPFGKKVYVKSNLVSTNGADILALQTIAKAKAYEGLKPEVKEKLLESLYKLPVSREVSDKISDL